MKHFRQIMQAAISIPLLLAAIYVMVINPTIAPDSVKWASNALSLLAGFWLRGR